MDLYPSLRAIAEGLFGFDQMIAIIGVNAEGYQYIMKKSSCVIPENDVKAFIGKKTELFSQDEPPRYESVLSLEAKQFAIQLPFHTKQIRRFHFETTSTNDSIDFADGYPPITTPSGEMNA